MQTCSHCGEGQSGYRWKVHAGSGQRVCAACARFAASHGDALPPPEALRERRQQEAQRKRQLQELREQEEAGAERRCTHCGTDHSKPWRLNLLTGERLCNACRSWQESHGGELPPPEHVHKRQRLQRQRQLEQEAGIQHKSCSHCGSESSPDGWLVHPEPNQDGRVCGRCGMYYRCVCTWGVRRRCCHCCANASGERQPVCVTLVR